MRVGLGGTAHLTIFAVVLALFFLSGMTGLVYQVIWTRYLVFVFGSTTFATATVLTVFMGGLALGSFVAGRVADKIKNRLLVYGILEGFIGAWALLAPILFNQSIPLYRAIWQHFHLSLMTFSLARFLVVSCILLPPTTAMGATLPLLARFVTDTLNVVGRRVGTLYSANTLGAVSGSLVAGFFLLPTIGLSATTEVAAAGNFLLLVATLICSRSRHKEVETKGTTDAGSIPENHDRSTPGLPVGIILTAFALSGALAMVYEVAWTRALLMVIGSTTFAFTIMLSVFLTGIFAGSLALAGIVDRLKSPLIWFALIEGAICFASLLSIQLFDFVPYWNLLVNAHFIDNPQAAMAVRFLLSAMILLPITLLLGATFPLVVKACADNLAAVGRSVGNLYSANTLGAIVGAFLGGFALVPAFGVEKTLIGTSFANLLLSVALIFLLPAAARGLKAAALVSLPCLLAFLIARPNFWDPLLVMAAQSQRRTLMATHKEILQGNFVSWADAVHKHSTLLFSKDGACATVGVVKSPSGTALLTSGHIDASDRNDMDVQLLLALYPMLVKPHARQVACIGWGSGVTVGAAALSAAKQVTAIEIEPAVIEGSKLFHHVNEAPESNPKVDIELNDGRNIMLAADAVYDSIISEPSNPWQAGVCNLFTREFFSACKQRLANGGVLALWLQLVEVSTTNMLHVLSALQSEYGYVLPLQANNSNLVVLAGKEPVKLDYESVSRLIESPAYKAKFQSIGIRTTGDVLCRIAASSSAVRAFTTGVVPNCDDRNCLEYEVARTYEHNYFMRENQTFLYDHSGNPIDNIDWGSASNTTIAGVLAQAAESALSLGPAGPDRALYWAGKSLSFEKNSAALRVEGLALISEEQLEVGKEKLLAALLMSPDDVKTMLALGDNERRQGRIMAARGWFEKAAKADGTNGDATFKLAQSYMPLVRGALSEPTHDRLADDPDRATQLLAQLPDGYKASHPDVQHLEAMIEFRKHNFDRASLLMQRYVNDNPLNLSAWRELTEIAQTRNDSRLSSESKRNADELSHELATELLFDASRLRSHGNEAAAMRKLNTAQRLDPANSKINHEMSGSATKYK
jgi:spermidine synthase